MDSTLGAPIKTRLWVRRSASGTWNFKILTKLPDHLQSQDDGFSGMVLVEDWSTGQISYVVYEHGRALTKLEWMRRNLQMGFDYRCEDIYVYDCVEDVCKPYYMGEECEGVEKANQMNSLIDLNSLILTIANSTIEIGHHFYAASPTDPTMRIGPAVTGTTSNWLPNFTWSPSPGHAIGTIHNHPSNSAPSPSDVLAAVNITQMKSLEPTDVDFVAKHNVSIVVTNAYIYTITIKDFVILPIPWARGSVC